MNMAWFSIVFTGVFLFASGAAIAQDADQGTRVFRAQCAVCHATQDGKNMVGPSLFGIVGRKSGSIPGFRYSAGNRDAGITWDAATLDKYLEAPKAMVPGTIMTYPGLKDPKQRADLIAYLGTLK